MAAAVFHQSLGTFLPHGQANVASNVPKLNSKCFKVEVGVFGKKSPRSRNTSIRAIQSSSSQTSVVDPILSPSINTSDDSQKKQSKLFVSNNCSF